MNVKLKLHINLVPITVALVFYLALWLTDKIVFDLPDWLMTVAFIAFMIVVILTIIQIIFFLIMCLIVYLRYKKNNKYF